MAFIIRQAECTDTDAITRVHIDSWQTAYRGQLPDDYLDSLAYDPRYRYWSNLLCAAERDQFVYVAVDEDNGRVIGFASGGKERSNDKDYSGELYAIYILEPFQGQGLGRMLTRRVAADLQRNNHNSMLIWVLTTNPSRQFYEKLGGQAVRTQLITIGERSYEETGYGWADINVLLA
jgi:GNAT superfamily N-acetyltransferase